PKMPDELRHTHYEKGARALERQYRIDKASGNMTGCEDLATRLASLSQPNYEFAWEAFADTQANPGPSALGDIIAGVGVKDVWRKLQAQSSGKGDLNIFLKSFIAIRNDCAHTGGSRFTP